MAATINGDPGNGNVLSYLPGQRLSRCTCSNDTTHPGPKHSDGTFVGRAAPEIDMFEAQMKGTPLVAQVSQSAQFAVSIFRLSLMYIYSYFHLLSRSMNRIFGKTPQRTKSSITQRFLNRILLLVAWNNKLPPWKRT